MVGADFCYSGLHLVRVASAGHTPMTPRDAAVEAAALAYMGVTNRSVPMDAIRDAIAAYESRMAQDGWVKAEDLSDVLAWLLLAWNAQQRIISPSDRLISLTARYQDRNVGDIIADAQRFRAAMLAARPRGTEGVVKESLRTDGEAGDGVA